MRRLHLAASLTFLAAAAGQFGAPRQFAVEKKAEDLEQAERMKDARAELFDVRAHQVPGDLFCQTCRAAVNIVQDRREAQIKELGHDSRHVLHFAYHLQKLIPPKSKELCAVSSFERLEVAKELTAERMHIACGHLIDHWDEAGENADHEHERPWFRMRKILDKEHVELARLYVEGGKQAPFFPFRVMEDEVEALCHEGAYHPCPRLKDEL